MSPDNRQKPPPAPSPAALVVAGWDRAPDFERAALLAIAAKRSPHTIKAYRADLERWLRFCYATGVNPANPGLSASIAFRDHLTATVSEVSARRVLSALSYLYRTLMRAQPPAAGGNPFHPAVLSWPVGSKIGKTPAVPEAVAEAMIADAIADPDRVCGARDAAVLRLLYDTGLRRASVAKILRSTLAGAKLHAVVKGGKTVEVALPPKAVEALSRWLAVAPASPYLFPGRSGAIGELTINRIVTTRAAAVGAKGVHPHCFRAAFITAGYDAGLPEHEIQAAAHHSDPRTTRAYDRGARGGAVADAVARHREGKDT